MIWSFSCWVCFALRTTGWLLFLHDTTVNKRTKQQKHHGVVASAPSWWSRIMADCVVILLSLVVSAITKRQDDRRLVDCCLLLSLLLCCHLMSLQYHHYGWNCTCHTPHRVRSRFQIVKPPMGRISVREFSLAQTPYLHKKISTV